MVQRAVGVRADADTEARPEEALEWSAGVFAEDQNQGQIPFGHSLELTTGQEVLTGSWTS